MPLLLCATMTSGMPGFGILFAFCFVFRRRQRSDRVPCSRRASSVRLPIWLCICSMRSRRCAFKLERVGGGEHLVFQFGQVFLGDILGPSVRPTAAFTGREQMPRPRFRADALAIVSG